MNYCFGHLLFLRLDWYSDLENKSWGKSQKSTIFKIFSFIHAFTIYDKTKSDCVTTMLHDMIY